MAINEKIVTGRKFRRLIDKEAKLWQRMSWWTKASDVEFDDGKTAEQKLGNINGITSDFSVNDENIAASSNLTNRSYTRFNEFTDNGKIHRIFVGEDGKTYIEYEDGADTVLKKLGDIDDEELTNSVSTSSGTKFTKGTWLYYVSHGVTIAPIEGNSNPNPGFGMTMKQCTISDPDINSIKRVLNKQAFQDGGGNKAYCGSFIYLIKVNTDTATINISYQNSSNNHYGIITNVCRVKISD